MELFELRPMPGIDAQTKDLPTEAIRQQMMSSAVLRGLAMLSNKDFQITPYDFSQSKGAEILNKQVMRGPVYHPPGGSK